MKKIISVMLFFMLPFFMMSQVTESPVLNVEQQLENITENNEDQETEDDTYLQELLKLGLDPINLNAAEENELNELKVLSPVQIVNLLRYRSILGNLLSIYEVQAIPGWDIHTIRKIKPFITVSNHSNLVSSLKAQLKKGEHSLMIRVSQVLERSKGYLPDSATKNFYPGSPQRILMRYKYIYKNLLQYGISGEKDPGEQFFKGKQAAGFDFYSAHIFIRDMGIIKALALGDFTVNLGQGLTQWQSLAFKKGPGITSAKRQSAVLKPYNSAGEINFHRGAGITIGKRNWEATIFGSFRKLDANFIPIDSLNPENIISSLQSSGYHRTKSEMEDKGIQQQTSFGGNFSMKIRKLNLGVNAIHYILKFPLVKDTYPYNRFALSGKSFGNYSLDYDFTYRNMHLYGEVASNGKNGLAILSGLMISVSTNADIGLVYRNISREYQSLYTNAFTESTFPANEKGLFAGISLKPATAWLIEAYVDIYKFPWLKFQVNTPSTGSDYFIQATYRPNRQLEIYSRFKRESKAANGNPEALAMSLVTNQPRKNWRTQFNFKINRHVTFRNRVELVWFHKNGYEDSRGFLANADLIYKPMLKPFSANIRLQYFETDDYNSRLYAYENDVLFSYSIPVFYNQGYRYYLNINYDITRKLSAWVRIAQTVNSGQSSIGSGLDEIKGNRKTELKLQMLYRL